MPSQIIQGADKALAVRLSSESTGDPFDLSSATEIEARFLNADGSCQHYDLSTGGVTILSAGAGKFQVNLPASGTSLLAPTDNTQDPLLYQGVEIHVEIAGKETIINLPSTIDVQPPLFPGC